METEVLNGRSRMTMNQRIETFRVEDGHLVHVVTPAHGQPYSVRCSQEVFEEITFVIEESDSGVTIAEIVERSKATGIQACSVLAFLQDRGCIVRQGRRRIRVHHEFHLDAMIEYFALAENG